MAVKLKITHHDGAIDFAEVEQFTEAEAKALVEKLHDVQETFVAIGNTLVHRTSIKRVVPVTE